MDVRADGLLNLHHTLGCKGVPAAVKMAAEDHALVAVLAEPAQTEELVAPRVGEDGAVPAHELVEVAVLLQHLGAGPQKEVVGVAEQNLDAGIFELVRRKALDRTDRTDRHEDGGLDGPPGQRDGGGPRHGGAVAAVEREAQFVALNRHAGSARLAMNMASP